MTNASDEIPESVLRLNGGHVPTTADQWHRVALALGRTVDQVLGLQHDEVERARRLGALLALAQQPTRRGRSEIWADFIVGAIDARVRSIEESKPALDKAIARAAIAGIRGPRSASVFAVLRDYAPPHTATFKLRRLTDRTIKQIELWRQKHPSPEKQVVWIPPFFADLYRSARQAADGRPALPDPKLVTDAFLKDHVTNLLSTQE